MKQYNYFMKVPNDNTGMVIINTIKNFINKDSYCIRLRGSKPDYDKVRADGIEIRPYHFQTHVPLKYAKMVRIYIHAKVVTRDGAGYLYSRYRVCGIDDVKRLVYGQ